MKHSTWRLWVLTFQSWFRIALVIAGVLLVIVLLPPNVSTKISDVWENFKRDFKSRHQPFYDFLTNEDMNKKFGERR